MVDKYDCGDTVTVKAIVTSDRTMIDGTVMCSFNAPLALSDKLTICVAEEDIVSHTPIPRPIQVGDIVKDIGLVCDDTYTVLAIHKEWAWVKPMKNDKCFTWRLDKLERV